jgi:hypothetical protein
MAMFLEHDLSALEELVDPFDPIASTNYILP